MLTGQAAAFSERHRIYPKRKSDLYRLDTEQALFDAFFRCRRALLRFPYKRAWEQSPADCLNGHLLAGRLGGGELLKQIGYFDGIFQTGKGLDRDARRQLWGYVVRQRLCEAGFGGLLAMTPVAAPGYLVLSFGTGMAIALVIAVCDVEERNAVVHAVIHKIHRTGQSRAAVAHDETGKGGVVPVTVGAH